MKNLFKMMKKGDVIIIGLLVILSFLPLALINSQKNRIEQSDDPIDYARITVNGEEIHRMELTDDGQIESYLYESEEGHMNLIEREGTTVYMADANCPDSLCIQQGKISKDGEVIVCLPHRVLVEIVSEGGSAEETEVDLISQ